MESTLPVACIDASHAIVNITYESAPLTVISSVLSMLGSSLVIISYFLWKDLRKSTARTILLFLAIADFMTSIGYFWSAIAYLTIFSNLMNATDYNDAINSNDTPFTDYEVICKIESFWDTYFPVVSFFWTANLAIYFVVTLVFLKISFAKKLMVPFHLTAWFIPLIICVYGIWSGWLGPTTDRGIEDATAGAWCFVSSAPVVNITNSTMYKVGLYYGMEAICGKGIEVVIYFIVIICYTMIIVFNKCRTNLAVSNNITFLATCVFWCFIDHQISSLNQRTTIHFRARHYLDISLVNTDLKLLLVPILFICIRSGGTIRFFISLYEGCRIPVYDKPDDGVCINQTCFRMLYDQGLVDLQVRTIYNMC